MSQPAQKSAAASKDRSPSAVRGDDSTTCNHPQSIQSTLPLSQPVPVPATVSEDPQTDEAQELLERCDTHRTPSPEIEK